MRFLAVVVVMLAALLVPCAVQAQEDDGWGEIVGLMNGLTAANQQLLNRGLLTMPAQPGMGGGLTPGFLEGLTSWSRAYAQVLQSVDGAFDVDGANNDQAGFYDPFNPNTPNPLTQELNRWQAATANQGAYGYQTTPRYPAYQTAPQYQPYPNRSLYGVSAR